MIKEVRDHYGDLVFKTIIPRNIRLSEAPSHGKPIILYDFKSKGADSYIDLAHELIQNHKRLELNSASDSKDDGNGQSSQNETRSQIGSE